MRASDEVVAWRLERQLFLALLHSHPEVRSSFEALARRHATEDFLLLYSSFSKLPPEALDRLADALEPVDVSAGDVVLSQDDPPGPMFVIEQGHFRAYRSSDGEEQDLEYLRTGDFFGELALLARSPRRRASPRSRTAGSCAFAARTSTRSRPSYPGVPERIEDRVAHHDFHRLAKVPLDFAEEILPAAAGHEQWRDGQAEPLTDPTTASRAFDGSRPEDRRTRRAEADRGASRTSTSSTRWTAAPRVSGWSAGTSARSQPRGSARPCHTSTDGTSLAGITAGADGARAGRAGGRASKSRLDELPLPAIVHWEGNHWVVLYEVGARPRPLRRPGARAPATPARRVPRAAGAGTRRSFSYTEQFEDVAERRHSLAWLWAFFRPHRRTLVIAGLLALVAAGLQLLLPIMTQVVIDQVLPDGDVGLLWIVLAMLVGVLLAITGATLVQRYLLARMRCRSTPTRSTS